MSRSESSASHQSQAESHRQSRKDFFESTKSSKSMSLKSQLKSPFRQVPNKVRTHLSQKFTYGRKREGERKIERETKGIDKEGKRDEGMNCSSHLSRPKSMSL